MAHRGAGCLLFASACLVAAGVAELGLRALGFETLSVRQDWTTFWDYDPVLGWRHRPGQQGLFERGDLKVEVRLNEKGLRDREYPYRRAAGTRRILAVGDSFVWGFGVAREEIFTERMEAALTGVEVINGGVSGYSTDQELLWLRDEGMKYRPDLVILVLTGNDPMGNRSAVDSFIYPKPYFVLDEDGGLELRGMPVPRVLTPRRLAHLGSSRSVLVNTVIGRSSHALRAWRARTPPAAELGASGRGPSEPFALTVALVDEMRRVAESGGARLQVAATAMYWRPDSSGTYEELLAALERRGFDVLDVEALEGFDGERMRLPNDGHWNGRGHAFVAARLIEHVERHWLVGTDAE